MNGSNKPLLRLLLKCAVIALTCCDKAEDDNEENRLSIVGDWTSTCTSIVDERPNSGFRDQSFTSTSSFTSTKRINLTRNFLGTNCDGPSQYETRTVYFFAVYSLQAASGKIDFFVEESFSTPLTDETVEEWNKIETCGISDWVKSEPRECPTSSDVLYDIFLVKGDALFFGDKDELKGTTEETKFNGRTEEMRPVSFGRSFVFKRAG